MNLNNTSSGKQYNNVGSGSQYNAENITIHHAADDSGDKDRQFLVDLKLSDPRLDKERIERTKGGLLKDSYLWILNNEDFQRWRADFQSRLLWIRGDPGKGKTMLLCGIVDELQNEKPACDPVYFFCQATDSNLNTASAVMRGVLYLILKKHVHLVKYLRDTHDHSSRQLFENENSWDALCSMVTSVFNDQCLHNTVLIIDALDECIGDGEKLLEFINKLSLKGVRIIASSRNSIPIERGVAAGTQNATHISLERNERSISASVAAFIRHKVTLLTRKHEYNTSTRKLVYDTLVEKANDTFLWAALVCQQLEVNSVNNWEVASKLQSFPPGLDILYARMLDQVMILATNADLFRQTLTVASLVFRPVNISELKHLIGSSGATIGGNRSLERASQQCGSFLTVRDDVVYFLHQSAKEFLLKAPIVGNIMPNGVIYEQNLLWSNSLKAISTTLRRNIYDLKLPGTPVEEVKSPKPDPLYSIKYCCVHWADHFCAMACKTYEKEQATELVSFLTRKYLQWLEAMSLRREVPRGIHCVTNTLRAVQG
ncbi:Vegetative incompatibility protein HET-E-1 [Colletotrichum tropicale]|nr:Vegetative incompatibility protein HET-E-1 [Colletotrichum tropicale]